MPKKVKRELCSYQLAANQVEIHKTTSVSSQSQPIKLSNSEALGDLDNNFYHMDLAQRANLTATIREFTDLFPDVPGRARGMLHDVDVGDARPITQHPYRISPQKLEIMTKEVDYMLEKNIVQPCTSNWSSTCLLVPKPDG